MSASTPPKEASFSDDLRAAQRERDGCNCGPCPLEACSVSVHVTRPVNVEERSLRL